MGDSPPTASPPQPAARSAHTNTTNDALIWRSPWPARILVPPGDSSLMWTTARLLGPRTRRRARTPLPLRPARVAADRARSGGADPRFHRSPETRSGPAGQSRSRSPDRDRAAGRSLRGRAGSHSAVDPASPATHAWDATPAGD